jgi:hypothetical protein
LDPLTIKLSAIPPPNRRRTRERVIRWCQNLSLAALLVLSLPVFFALAAVYSEEFAGRAEAWMVRSFTSKPDAYYAAARAAWSEKNHRVAARAAWQFLQSVPLPHPADTYAAKFRDALQIALESGASTNNTFIQLEASRLAVRFDPNDSVALYEAGGTLEAIGQPNEAIIALEMAHRIRPMSAQIITRLSVLLRRRGRENEIAAFVARHHEALALCLRLPAWRTGNLIISDRSGGSRAISFEFGKEGEAILEVPLDSGAKGAYLTLPCLAHTSYHFDRVELLTAGSTPMPLAIEPQNHLRLVGSQRAMVVPELNSHLDGVAVVNVVLPLKIPAGASLLCRGRLVPEPVLHPWSERFGTWDHPELARRIVPEP